MGKNKKYSGYQPFQYLEPDVDYKAFKLCKAEERFPVYWMPLTKTEEEKANELLEKCITISMHEHPVLLPENVERDYIGYESEGREFIAYDGLSHACLDAVFDDMMDGTAYITSKEGWKWDDVIYDLGFRLSDIAHQDFVIKCEKIDDILNAHKNGKVALIPSVEGAACIENETDRIDIIYGLGVRKLGITYSECNALGSGGGFWPKDGGLTDFGYDCVKRMNKIGMAIDISHCGYQTTLDAIEASSKPLTDSHSGAAALYGGRHGRGKPDEVLRALAEKGGVIGISAAPTSTWTVNHPEHTIDSYMEHMEYCIKLMGIDHVGVGPDSIYGDHVALGKVWHNQKGRVSLRTRAHSQARTSGLQKGGVGPKQIEYVKGAENPSECLVNVARWLVKHGYSDKEIEKVIGGNALRFLRSSWCR